MIAAALFALSIAATSGPSIFTEAEARYAQAAALVAKTPATGAASDKLFQLDRGPYADFTNRYAQFDAHLQALGTKVETYVGLELVSFGSFLGYSVAAAQNCDRPRALVMLHIAREYLDDAKRGSPAAKAADGPDATVRFPADQEKALAEADTSCPDRR